MGETIDLLHEAGIEYVADRVLDDHILSHPDMPMCTGAEILDIYRAQALGRQE